MALFGGLGGTYAWWKRSQRGAPLPEPPRLTVRPPGALLSAFNGQSTAEEVTEGVDLGGKTVLVTGATSGIGLETMRVLALRGAHVIGTGRSLASAESACGSVKGHASALALELTDFDSVVRCADAVRRMDRPLDVLVCNAGVMGLRRLEQVHGIEKQFVTNHLGHYLLARRLLDRIIAAPQGRVVVVSSYVMNWSSPSGIEWDNLSGERDYHPNRAYGQSKLANALFSFELARRLRGTAATSNSLEPGYVDTGLFKHYPVSLRGFRGLLAEKAPVAQGAATSCYVAASPALAMSSGYHFAMCNPLVPIPRAHDEAAARKLWEVSETLVEPYLRA